MRWTRFELQTTRTAVLAAMAVAFVPITAAAQTTSDALRAESVRSSTIEVGGGAASQASFKAGEYNGLAKKGAFDVTGFDLHDQHAYDSTSALRWRVKGTDVGLESRNIAGDLRVQGAFRLFFVYDELLRNRSDSYQTPFDGAGTNVLTLPSSWLFPTVAGGSATNSNTNNLSARGLVPSIGTAPYIDPRTASPTFGGLILPNAAQISQVTSAANTDLPFFHNVNLTTKRRSYDIGGNVALTDHVSASFDVRPEHKEGLKPMGTVSRNTGGDVSTIIPDRIDTDHNQYTVNLNVKGAKSYGQLGYYGSFFRNQVPFMSWQNWETSALTTNTMSSTPNNDFSQVNGSTGYSISKTTKVVGSASYSRATQNQTFLTDTSTPVVPVGSLNGLVVSSFASARLTSRPAKNLSTTVAYKYDNHDNQTPVNIFQYADAGEAPSPNSNFPAGPTNPLGAVLAQNANANRSYSRRMNMLTGDADYAVAPHQWVKGGYEFERVIRDCPGSWISCADAGTTNESTARAEWRADASTVNARIEYAYGMRRTPDYNENAFLALVPYANVVPATGTQSAYAFMIANGLTGYGPVAGYANTTGDTNRNLFFGSNNALANALYANNNRISELIGMRRYYVADRNRNKFRTLVDWQATHALAVEGRVDVNRDAYPTSVYGLKTGRSAASTADVTYAVSTHFSADAFYTYENQNALANSNSYTANSNTATITGAQATAVGLSGNACDGYTTLLQRNNNNKVDPCLDWTTDMVTKAHTAGASLTHKTGHVDLTANFILTRVSSDSTFTGGNWANNPVNGPGGAPTTIAAFFIAATPTPTVTTRTAELRLNGKIDVNTHQAVRVAYAYLRMRSTDYMYEGTQIGPGTITGVLPTNEQPFTYSDNVVSGAYVITF